MRTKPRRRPLACWLVAVLTASPFLLGAGSPAAPAASQAAALPGCAPADHPGGQWRSYGHDYANTRTQPLEKTIGPTEAPTLAPAWAFSAADGGGEGDFTGTPVIADGCLYVGSNGGWVFAVNADTGEPVWSTQLPNGGGVNSTPYVTGGTVYVGVSRVGSPYLAALDQATGEVRWETAIDGQPGSDVYGSPVVFDDVLIIGVSGGSAELGDEADRYAFQGSFVLIETGSDPEAGRVPGEIIAKTWTIHPPGPSEDDPQNQFAGATVWSTAAVDPAAKVGYVGTGNPFQPQAEDEHANAIVRFDLDRDSPTFGQILGSYKGTVDEYVPGFSELPCYDIPGNPPPYYPQGIGQCGDIDLDFGASPNLFTGPDGRLLVGEGQKSGVYHVADAATMDPVWTSVVGPPSAVGGIVGSTAVDDGGVYGPITVGGYLWSLGRADGAPRWVSPIGDGAHWGNPVSVANGVVYTVDLRGFLSAYAAATGVPLLHRPLKVGTDSGSDPMLSWGGVSVARNTVYAAVGITSLAAGYVIAFRPGGTPAPPPAPEQAATQIVAGPGAQFSGYLTPVVVATSDGEIVFTNADIVRHNVVQDPRVDGVAGPDDQPWCDQFPAGQCPLFWSPLIGLGESAQLQGLENAEPGTYSFYCTLHPGMKGQLIVLG